MQENHKHKQIKLEKDEKERQKKLGNTEVTNTQLRGWGLSLTIACTPSGLRGFIQAAVGRVEDEEVGEREARVASKEGIRREHSLDSHGADGTRHSSPQAPRQGERVKHRYHEDQRAQESHQTQCSSTTRRTGRLSELKRSK